MDVVTDQQRASSGEDSDMSRQMAERMAQITREAHRTNLARVDRLGALVAAGAGPQQRSEAGEIAHKLAGSAGTFGYTRVSDRARDLELYLITDDDGHPPSPLPPEQQATLQDWVRELRELLAAEPDEVN